MNCPHCDTEPLVVLEAEQIEVDYCDVCRGVWLDAGELELLFGDAEACRRFLSIGSPAKAPAGEKVRRCPECGTKMTKEATTGSPAVVFDHCPEGDGLWFDAGELHTILSHPEVLEGEREVVRLLKEIFQAGHASE